jgi:hypothetical protein
MYHAIYFSPGTLLRVQNYRSEFVFPSGVTDVLVRQSSPLLATLQICFKSYVYLLLQ